jgi:hypothetical protein
MVYRYTQDARFLVTAQQLADYFINHLPADFVPYWDFSQSGTAPRDSSAAAIAAAGLLELSTYVRTQADRDRYRTAALNIQSSLSSPAYLGDRAATDGTLLHGSANVPGNSDNNVSLIYGDYYFVQGCNRAATPPGAPANLATTLESNGQISLTWDTQPGAIRYSVKRSTSSGGPYTTLAPPPILTVNQFIDANAIPNTTYFYVVSAINASAESPNSAEATTPVNNPVPSISSVSPVNVAAGAGFVLTINGTNFLPTSVVTFAGKPQPATFVSAARLTAAISATDAAAGGSASIVVSNIAPGGGPSAALLFTLDDFTMATSSSSVAISSGKSAVLSLTVSPSDSNGFASPVSFAVSTLPSGVSATFNPPSLSPGANGASTAVTFSSTTQSQGFVRPESLRVMPMASPIVLIAITALLVCLAVGIALFKRWPRLHPSLAVFFFCLFVLGFVTFSGCGSGNPAPSATPPPTAPVPTISQVTVTATSGTDVKTSIITLSVQ